jgi:hypothetical protein
MLAGRARSWAALLHWHCLGSKLLQATHGAARVSCATSLLSRCCADALPYAAERHPLKNQSCGCATQLHTQLLTEVMYLNAIIVLALFFVTMRMYRSLCRRYMKVQEPRVRTGACVLTELSLLFRICVLKFSAMSRLQ